MEDNLENRACGCKSNTNPMPVGTNMQDTSECDCNNNKQRELLNSIRELDFAIQELALYLDTHPMDERALCLHREYCKQLRNAEDMYQRVYGPLSIKCPCNKWRWIEEPWE